MIVLTNRPVILMKLSHHAKQLHVQQLGANNNKHQSQFSTAGSTPDYYLHYSWEPILQARTNQTITYTTAGSQSSKQGSTRLLLTLQLGAILQARTNQTIIYTTAGSHPPSKNQPDYYLHYSWEPSSKQGPTRLLFTIQLGAILQARTNQTIIYTTAGSYPPSKDQPDYYLYNSWEPILQARTNQTIIYTTAGSQSFKQGPTRLLFTLQLRANPPSKDQT